MPSKIYAKKEENKEKLPTNESLAAREELHPFLINALGFVISGQYFNTHSPCFGESDSLFRVICNSSRKAHDLLEQAGGAAPFSGPS